MTSTERLVLLLTFWMVTMIWGRTFLGPLLAPLFH